MASFGVIQSLVPNDDDSARRRQPGRHGYPARSFFNVYHLLETPVGSFFNKKPTQMELQPDREGKLALKLPPIPFLYELTNGPIPLFDVEDPDGAPVADVVAAAHHDNGAVREATAEDWPYHRVDEKLIQKADELRSARRASRD